MAAPGGELKPVESSLFEGLFRRALKPSDAMKKDLLGIGVDVDRLEPRYGSKTWNQAVHIARRHTFPNHPESQGLRELGRKFGEGFFDTIIGKVIAIGLDMMGPDTMVKMSPRSVRAGRTDITVIPTKLGDRKWRVEVSDVNPLPDFFSGLIEIAGRKAKTPGIQVVVVSRQHDRYTLEISW